MLPKLHLKNRYDSLAFSSTVNKSEINYVPKFYYMEILNVLKIIIVYYSSKSGNSNCNTTMCLEIIGIKLFSTWKWFQYSHAAEVFEKREYNFVYLFECIYMAKTYPSDLLQ